MTVGTIVGEFYTENKSKDNGDLREKKTKKTKKQNKNTPSPKRLLPSLVLLFYKYAFS